MDNDFINSGIHITSAFDSLTNLRQRLSSAPYGGVMATDRFGNTPLHYAAYFRRTECMKELIARGALINGQNRFGQTPQDLVSLPLPEIPAYQLRCIVSVLESSEGPMPLGDFYRRFVQLCGMRLRTDGLSLRQFFESKLGTVVTVNRRTSPLVDARYDRLGSMLEHWLITTPTGCATLNGLAHAYFLATNTLMPIAATGQIRAILARIGASVVPESHFGEELFTLDTLSLAAPPPQKRARVDPQTPEQRQQTVYACITDALNGMFFAIHHDAVARVVASNAGTRLMCIGDIPALFLNKYGVVLSTRFASSLDRFQDAIEIGNWRYRQAEKATRVAPTGIPVVVPAAAVGIRPVAPKASAPSDSLVKDSMPNPSGNASTAASSPAKTPLNGPPGDNVRLLSFSECGAQAFGIAFAPLNSGAIEEEAREALRPLLTSIIPGRFRSGRLSTEPPQSIAGVEFVYGEPLSLIRSDRTVVALSEGPVDDGIIAEALENICSLSDVQPTPQQQSDAVEDRTKRVMRLIDAVFGTERRVCITGTLTVATLEIKPLRLCLCAGKPITGIARCFGDIIAKSGGKVVAFIGCRGCGKTTVLRDFAREFHSNGYNVAVVDTYQEIGGGGFNVHGSIKGCNRLGARDPGNQSQSIKMAVEMQADVIIIDAIISSVDVAAVLSACDSGATVLCSTTSASLQAFKDDPILSALMGVKPVVVEIAERNSFVIHRPDDDRAEKRWLSAATGNLKSSMIN